MRQSTFESVNKHVATIVFSPFAHLNDRVPQKFSWMVTCQSLVKT